jgi:hypothetical protein
VSVKTTADFTATTPPTTSHQRHADVRARRPTRDRRGQGGRGHGRRTTAVLRQPQYAGTTIVLGGEWAGYIIDDDDAVLTIQNVVA